MEEGQGEEIIECNDCGYVGPNEDNGLSASFLMDEWEAGEIDNETYQSLMEGTRFACPQCGCLNTQIPM